MTPKRLAVLGCVLLALGGCATPQHGVAPVRIVDRGPNAVSLWGERGAAIINQPPSAAGTLQERRPTLQLDMATLHLAMFEAAAVAPPASQETAVHAAGLAVLTALFPQRAAQHRAAWEAAVAALPAGPAREQGLAIGAERAAAVLERRADDGRWAEVTPAVPGTTAGAFRGVNPILQMMPRVRPFALDSLAQVRGAAPPALDSAAWAGDLAETMARGGEGRPASTREVEGARFHSEPPGPYWARNLNRFARSQPALADNARLMAVLWVTQADAIAACFDAKYHHYRWRPASAIALSDAAWKPRLPTPNHPEYPAAHGCATAAVAEALAQYFGTREVSFAFDSTVTGTTHEWPSVDALVEECRDARIVGGMHFRSSMMAGEQLGTEVARRVAAHPMWRVGGR